MSTGKKFSQMTNEQKNIYIEKTSDFCKWFTDLFNLPIYLIYGTLLGCVREKDFIDSDNDIDLAYVSNYNKFEDVFKEMLLINTICSNLGKVISYGEGSNLPRFCGHSHFYFEEKRFVFDVWTSWIDKNGKYQFYSMGKNLDKDILFPFQEGILRGKKFFIPNKSEELLTYLYSNDWKTPLNRKSYYYNKNHWKPFIDIYTEKFLNRGTK